MKLYYKNIFSASIEEIQPHQTIIYVSPLSENSQGEPLYNINATDLESLLRLEKDLRTRGKIYIPLRVSDLFNACTNNDKLKKEDGVAAAISPPLFELKNLKEKDRQPQGKDSEKVIESILILSKHAFSKSALENLLDIHIDRQNPQKFQLGSELVEKLQKIYAEKFQKDYQETVTKIIQEPARLYYLSRNNFYLASLLAQEQALNIPLDYLELLAFKKSGCILLENLVEKNFSDVNVTDYFIQKIFELKNELVKLNTASIPLINQTITEISNKLDTVNLKEIWNGALYEKFVSTLLQAGITNIDESEYSECKSLLIPFLRFFSESQPKEWVLPGPIVLKELSKIDFKSLNRLLDHNKVNTIIAAIVQNQLFLSDIINLEDSHFKMLSILNYRQAKFLLNANGIQAIKDELITLEDTTQLSERELTVLLSDEAFSAFTNNKGLYNNLCTDNSHKKVSIIKCIISSVNDKQLFWSVVEFLDHEHLRALATSKGQRALKSKLITISQAECLSLKNLNILLDYFDNFEEVADKITVKNIINYKVTSAVLETLLTTEKGLMALKKETINLKDLTIDKLNIILGGLAKKATGSLKRGSESMPELNEERVLNKKENMKHLSSNSVNVVSPFTFFMPQKAQETLQKPDVSNNLSSDSIKEEKNNKPNDQEHSLGHR